MNAHPLSLPASGSLPQDEELKRLQDVRLRINKALPFLLKQRADASRRVNALQSATRNLPPEILSIIFDHACTFYRNDNPVLNSSTQYPDPLHFLLSLARVSSCWRQTIYSNPQLWTFIRINFKSKPSKTSLFLLVRYLKQSGSLDVDLDLCFNPVNLGLPMLSNALVSGWPTQDLLVHPSIDSLIVENLHRVRTLHLRGASIKWFTYTPKLTNLTSFSYSCNRDIVYDTLLIPSLRPAVQRLPRDSLASFQGSLDLKELSLVGSTYIDIYSIRCASITIVSLSHVERTTCLDLLGLCSNLVEYCCQYSKRTPGPPRPSGKPLNEVSWTLPVTLASLKIFRWDMPGQADSMELMMLRNIHVPILEELGLRIWGTCSQPHLREFCGHLPSSVTTLHLSTMCPASEPSEQCIINAFSPELKVEHLTIGCLGSRHSADHALTALQNPDLFPRVRRLELFGPFPLIHMHFDVPAPPSTLPLPPHLSGSIVEIIRARAIRNHITGFVIELKRISLTWTSEARQLLREMEKQVGRKLLNMVQS